MQHLLVQQLLQPAAPHDSANRGFAEGRQAVRWTANNDANASPGPHKSGHRIGQATGVTGLPTIPLYVPMHCVPPLLLCCTECMSVLLATRVRPVCCSQVVCASD